MKETLNSDISLELISEEEIRQKLATIFVDSIILDCTFNIVVASKNIQDTLDFTAEELKGESINYLTKKNLKQALQAELGKGFFEEIVATLNTKAGCPIVFSISGFYLGLISDLNGYIVLKLKNLDEIRRLNQELEDNRAELDKFIYRTAHDLRGPLATIRGLVNLIKLRKDDSEIDLLAGMLQANAEKLDDRLFKLLYLAESGDTLTPCGYLNMFDLETSLRETLVQNCPVDQVALQFRASQDGIRAVNEQWVMSLMNNLLLYLISLPRLEENLIAYYLFSAQDGIEVRIKSTGFETSDKLQQAIRQRNSLYSDMLTYPNLIHFYAAQKIAQKLHAHIRINFVEEYIQEVSVFIPFGKFGD